ncbi:MAG: hypothetical protein A3G33_04005 [Omnitrophica bacterium RIFCSPLOWO2_12_FULL_44_17]|uniref:Uncharacterized protein n=1 Tax=Candidatus Danuiimicrobium aquiferis TaxID=1801832 RepID=A0A1G1KZG3_9BACT|nr:MAG: hypothetical protein A3B72_05285 [Omnitrophica bacterium RIFCSPHIGHO2_02_FULL_45_28]OGW89116.1 MAG: hypothetical protein A3E74_08770 [Omnitrophica bacterium RIFCSPHIGHO2_12_FULL_44_12]OGW98295.1 MAG: hypothetical protein A3G33_04005 [Omnitrophica bacterium RIFCSPLOWO2_12_FULL_44_17]OGX02889.1 MAG: hypothetical protein A3J12_04565 [Omnitrophica bacterium RIFCSPLOWO2_02_FULL_44_11]
MKIAITSNGCSRRNLDSVRIQNYFRLNRCKIVSNFKDADYILFVTCAFREGKAKECFAQIDELSKYSGDLIVVGCLPDIDPLELTERFHGPFISTKNLDRLDHLFPDFKIKFNQVSDAHILPKTNISEPQEKISLKLISNRFHLTRNAIGAFLKREKQGEAHLRVSWGCVENCAYCGVRKAVGPLKSKSIMECLEEYKLLLQKGYRDFLFVADNLGAYGLDIKTDFSQLLKQLSAIDRYFRVRWQIWEIHPRWVIKYEQTLIEYIKAEKITMLLSAVQSGNDRILKVMNRHHNAETIKEVYLKIKEENPSIVLKTQVIVGFPGETDEEFKETLEFLRQVRFSLVAVYGYYDSFDTIASHLPSKLSSETIQERLRYAGEFLNRERISNFVIQ